MDIGEIILGSLCMEESESLGNVKKHTVDPKGGAEFGLIPHNIHRPKMTTLCSANMIPSSAVGNEHDGSAPLTYPLG